MTPPIIPIQPIDTDAHAAVRMGVGEIHRFLTLFYPAVLIDQHQSSQAIAGQWLARIPRFHADDDFLHIVRDFLSHILSQGEPSIASDRLIYFFSGYMPSYGAAAVLLDMAHDRRPWSEIQAFMHGLGYGDAQQHIENFDWKSGQQKAESELRAWYKILTDQDEILSSTNSTSPTATGGAAAGMAGSTAILRHGGMTASLPRSMPMPNIQLPSVGSTARLGQAAARALSRVIGFAARSPKHPLLLILVPTPIADGTLDAARQRELAIYRDTLANPAIVDTTNNTCTPQIQENQRNGTQCENDGYDIMEGALGYQRLANPPRGRGLDGLFEKKAPLDSPNPMPDAIDSPAGKLLFIPPDQRPPAIHFDYVQSEGGPTYPKYVVFEAKHISKTFDPSDTDGISKEAKRRLRNTCDGRQMGNNWTVPRIPQALERNPISDIDFNEKVGQILRSDYALWVFACFPGASDGSIRSKLYTFIDTQLTNMKLDETPPRPSKSNPSSVKIPPAN